MNDAGFMISASCAAIRSPPPGSCARAVSCAIAAREGEVIDVAAIKSRFEAVAPFLDERGRRLVAASEALTAGRGGVKAVCEATAVARSTIGRGLAELRGGENHLGGR